MANIPSISDENEHTIKPSEVAKSQKMIFRDMKKSLATSSRNELLMSVNARVRGLESDNRGNFTQFDTQAAVDKPVIRKYITEHCPAIGMHRYAFHFNEPCSVCNMTIENCLAAEMHHYAWEQGALCSVCGADKA